MQINKTFLFLFLFLGIFIYPIETLSQDINEFPEDALAPSDTAVTSSDSIVLSDSIPSDTLRSSSNAIDAPVIYESADSMVMILDDSNLLYLYGKGNVKYNDLELSAEFVEVNTDSSLVYATFALDSVGSEFGYPIFKQGSTEYESKSMRYNFRTKKGFITDVVTQQGEGFVTAGRTKRMSNEDLFMVNGRYTTCDDPDCPHFYLRLTKAKVVPGKTIVTGPAYLVVEEVPLPIALPFGFFPFTSDYSSGIIMPTYGDELDRGFSLRDGGYYFAFNDYVDMALTGEIYTKGSWGLNARSTYKKRYKYSGNVNASYMFTKTEDTESKDFKLVWSHTQDPKADPYRRLSASVNFTTNSYDQIRAINETASLNPNYTQNTKTSTINISQSFPTNPLTLNASISVNQQTRDSTTSITLPNLSIGYGQTYPFRRKKVVGNLKWYELISISYTGSLRNSITAKDSMVFKSNLVKDWRNSFQHSVPVSATFNLFKHLNITPSLSFQSHWQTRRILKDFNDNGNLVPSDTTYGFYMINQFSGSIGFNTKLYGFFKPWKIFGDKVQMIRHVFTPRISISGSPDFGSDFFRYYEEVSYYNGLSGEYINDYYSPYAEGVPGRNSSGSISFGFDNNIEMKVKSDSDSTGFKKISLIDNLGMNISHNLQAKTWSDISMNLRLKITKSYTFNMSAVFDTHAYDENRKEIGQRWDNGRGIARFQSTGSSFSYSFNNEWLKRLLNKEKDSGSSESSGEANPEIDGEDNLGEEGQQSEKTSLRRGKKDTGEYDSDGYLITNIPWNVSFNFGMNIGYGNFNKEKKEYNYKVSKNLGLQGNITPTKGWSFAFSSSYDFDVKKFTTMHCSVTRDLHCWQLTASIVPFGPYQNYSFTIAVKSSMLQDLKYTQSSSHRDAVKWE